MRATKGVVLALVLFITGCPVGPNPAGMAPAQGPKGTGASVALRVNGVDTIETGELVAVREDDLLLLTSRGLIRAPNELIRSATFSDARPGRVQGAGSDVQRASLAQFSRYPFGLDGERLARLLRAIGQSELLEPGR